MGAPLALDGRKKSLFCYVVKPLFTLASSAAYARISQASISWHKGMANLTINMTLEVLFDKVLKVSRLTKLEAR